MMNIIVMRLLQCDIKQGTYIEDMSHVCWREDEEGGRENVTVIWFFSNGSVDVLIRENNEWRGPDDLATFT
jgi:hypothetical protein